MKIIYSILILFDLITSSISFTVENSKRLQVSFVYYSFQHWFLFRPIAILMHYCFFQSWYLVKKFNWLLEKKIARSMLADLARQNQDFQLMIIINRMIGSFTDSNLKAHLLLNQFEFCFTSQLFVQGDFLEEPSFLLSVLKIQKVLPSFRLYFMWIQEE